MKRLLCAFCIVLAVCIYPIFLRVPIEIAHVFGLIEIDIFSWYRMWLIVIFGSLPLLFSGQQPPRTLVVYWLTVIASAAISKFTRTSIFGAPWVHEGILVLMGYAGTYLAAKRYGFFKGLEKSLDAVVVIMFIACVLQLQYGSILNFAPIKSLVPDLKYEALKWPLYATLGCGNHLGLFCALFFPYTLLKKKYFLVFFIIFMAIGSECRASWLAIGLTMLVFMERKSVLIVVIITILLLVPYHKRTLPILKRTFHEIHFPIRDKDLSGRAYIWKRSLPSMKRALFLGYGPATYAMHFPQHEKRGDAIGFNNVVVDRPHNMYLNIWICSGLISLIVLMCGIGRILWSAKDIALQASCIAFLIAGLFTDSVLCVTPYFIIFLGCLGHRDDRLLIDYH